MVHTAGSSTYERPEEPAASRKRRHSHLGGLSPEQFEQLRNDRAGVSTESWELHARKRRQ